MTNTLPARSASRPSAHSRDSAVGQHHFKRSVIDIGMVCSPRYWARNSWTGTTCAIR